MSPNTEHATAHASASGVNLSSWPAGIEFDQIEHLEAPEVGDTISRLARLHAEERAREHAQALELELIPKVDEPLRYRDAPCRRAERAGLAVVGGYLLGGLAAVLGALWIAGVSVDVALQMAGVR